MQSRYSEQDADGHLVWSSCRRLTDLTDAHEILMVFLAVLITP